MSVDINTQTQQYCLDKASLQERAVNGNKFVLVTVGIQSCTGRYDNTLKAVVFCINL